jgi:hypothetical protein
MHWIAICAEVTLSVPTIRLGPLDPLLTNLCRDLNRNFDIFNFDFGPADILFIWQNPFLKAKVEFLCQF